MEIVNVGDASNMVFVLLSTGWEVEETSCTLGTFVDCGPFDYRLEMKRKDNMAGSIEEKRDEH